MTKHSLWIKSVIDSEAVLRLLQYITYRIIMNVINYNSLRNSYIWVSSSTKPKKFQNLQSGHPECRDRFTPFKGSNQNRSGSEWKVGARVGHCFSSREADTRGICVSYSKLCSGFHRHAWRTVTSRIDKNVRRRHSKGITNALLMTSLSQVNWFLRRLTQKQMEQNATDA